MATGPASTLNVIECISNEAAGNLISISEKNRNINRPENGGKVQHNGTLDYSLNHSFDFPRNVHLEVLPLSWAGCPLVSCRLILLQRQGKTFHLESGESFAFSPKEHCGDSAV